MFFETYKSELIDTAFVVGILFFIGLIINLLIKKIGNKNGINSPRIKLICKYVTVSLILIGILIEVYVFGVKFEEIAIIFSSVFAILGIALFAVWSVLSNVTSGIILFFSYPYKVGDKIKIHDSDLPQQEAIIEDIGAFQLHLRLENGDLVTYPNNLILQKPVTLVEKDAIQEAS
ncbi:mechanosensitive ion channel domain-containing protein [Seonamhaeicola sp. ML3]|uniref:mechanosensitive ion channel domain-containing protein n=1 Tax=Seonamhaeicola sp. ML3 TaxID=2937786 RepID=UPI00200C1A44|nr:mechanosensitive ion channel domain-containing protein [Seonamhaeicola sp. ML3]